MKGGRIGVCVDGNAFHYTESVLHLDLKSKSRVDGTIFRSLNIVYLEGNTKKRVGYTPLSCMLE